MTKTYNNQDLLNELYSTTIHTIKEEFRGVMDSEDMGSPIYEYKFTEEIIENSNMQQAINKMATDIINLINEDEIQKITYPKVTVAHKGSEGSFLQVVIGGSI